MVLKLMRLISFQGGNQYTDFKGSKIAQSVIAEGPTAKQ